MIRKSLLLLLLAINSSVFAQSTEEEFQPSGKPIVQIFSAAYYQNDNNRYNYNFSRAHLGYQYQFSPDWSAKIIIDRGRSTSVGEISVSDSLGNLLSVQNSSTEGAFYTMFLKFASLQWNVNDNLKIEAGAILQNHYITQERFWSLRYVAQIFQDLYWQIPSSDLGFIAYYKLNSLLSFDAAVTNGEGPRIKQDDQGKVKISTGLNITPSEKWQIRAYYHNRFSNEAYTENEQMYSAFVGFKPSEKFRVGGEINYMQNLNYTNNLNSYGSSLYSGFHFTKKTELFARYDRLLYEEPEPATSTYNEDGNTIITGISHSPVKDVNLSLNYRGWFPDSNNSETENRFSLNMEIKF